jgi:two-component system, NarL family, sensor histidine kinase YdfH
MTNPVAVRPAKMDVDLRWLLGLLTLVAVIMYGVVLFTTPAVRAPIPLITLTFLLAVHLVLHWQLFKVVPHSAWLNGYIVLQGLLFFFFSLLSRSPNMIFPLFAGLIGEAVGTLGINRRGILAGVYYLGLLFAGFVLLFDLGISTWLFVGTLAIVVTTVLYTVLFKRQVEARGQAQALLRDLEQANRQLTEYASRVEELTTAAERQRMARELHDTLSQGLAGLVLQLEAVSAHLKHNRPERALGIVEEAMEIARGTLAESRQAIADLRQGGLRDLEEAARREAGHFSASTGIPCAVEIALPGCLPEPVNQAAIRAVSEGLTNIARHARARHVRLRLGGCESPFALEMELNDDGIGFEPEAVEAGHYGLLGMRERVALAGGSLEVRSAPGKGTDLVIRFPLENDSHE